MRRVFEVIKTPKFICSDLRRVLNSTVMRRVLEVILPPEFIQSDLKRGLPLY